MEQLLGPVSHLVLTTFYWTKQRIYVFGTRISNNRDLGRGKCHFRREVKDIRQLALGCEYAWVKVDPRHGMYENTREVSVEFKRYFHPPSAGGFVKTEKKILLWIVF